MEKVNFGKAIEALKEGKAAKRENWNGKGMSIHINPGSVELKVLGLPHDENLYQAKKGMLIEGIDAKLFFVGHEGTITRLPNLNMRTPSGSTVTGWLASQTDILAEDWIILDNKTIL